MLYLPWSLKYGKVAGANPWHAVGLEWETSSPPPAQNFLSIPMVTHEAYAYGSVQSNVDAAFSDTAVH
jgi:cytochrome c oxidase subunit I